MNLSSADQILQYSAWFLTLIEVILALYILLLNAWHTSNRHVSALFMLMAINNFAVGLMISAIDATQAALPTYLLAATSPAIQPGLLLVTVILLKPRWLRGRWRRVWWLVYGVVFLPVLLTLLDVGLGTRLWYTGFDAAAYAGGYMSLFEYTAGSLSLLIRVLNFYGTPVVAIVPLLYVALRDKEATPLTRRLAWLLLGGQIVGVTFQMGLRGLFSPTARVLIVGAVFVLAYAYAGFQQMISERRLQRGRLQTRLMVLILVITVPILVAVVAFVSARAGALIEQVAVQQPEAELLGALRQFQRVSWTVLAVGVAMLLVLAWLTIRQAFRPIGALTDTAATIAAGDLTRTAPVESEDEIGILARTFNQMTEQLRGLIGTLEQRVTDRTRDLERRTRYLEASAQVARDATSVLEPQQLLERVVALISERFGFYHAGIFLLDENREWAVLQAVSSEGGRRMLARGHRLEVGEVGIVGYVTGRGEPRVVLDVGEDAVFLDNPDLPETRSEMALPLRARGEIIGALDVQSTEPGAFSDEDVAVLQTLADQVAMAISNAQLFQQVQESLERAQRAYGELGREAWAEVLRARPSLGYYCDESGVTPVTGRPDGHGEKGLPELAIPITVRGRPIGTVSAHKPSDTGKWATEEIALMETLTERLEVALESARLYQDTQRRAARERLTGEVTARMRETLDMETVLKTATNEIYQALGLDEIVIRLAAQEQTTG